jgi:Protein of unknown function (DUF3307)
MEILLLLFLLQVKHCYADFVIQTYKQTVHKGIYRDPIGISHSVDHVWTSLVALLVFSFFYATNPFIVIWLCFAEGILHYHIDFIKVHYGCKDNTKPIFWAQFGYDQLAHQITYLVMALILLNL